MANKSTLKSMFWVSVEVFGQQGIQLIVLVVLSRLLNPEDYGVLGLTSVFIIIAQVFLDGGFGLSLIRSQKNTNIDYSTVFYFNILISLFLIATIYFTSPFIADYYDSPKLKLVLKLVALTILIDGLGLIQRTILTKNMEFQKLSFIQICSGFISGVFAIVMAYRGFGIWALVAQRIIMSIINTIGVWIASKWRPTSEFSYSAFKRHFSFGSKLLLSGVIDRIFYNSYTLIIGKIYDPLSLGYYTQAVKIHDLPVINFSTIISKVSISKLAPFKDNNDLLKREFQKLVKLSSYVSFPMMVLLAISAYPLIFTFLGEKWIPSVKYIQVLALAGTIYPLHVLNLSIINIKGKSGLFLKLEIVKKILTIIVILLTYRYGILSMVAGQVVLSYMSFVVNSFFSGNLIGYKMLDQVKDISIYYIVTIVSFLLVVPLLFWNYKYGKYFAVTPFVFCGVFLILSMVLKLEIQSVLISKIRFKR